MPSCPGSLIRALLVFNFPKTMGRLQALLIPLSALVLLPLVPGCHSSKGQSSPHLASVTISDRSFSQVEDVTRAVFQDHQYLGLRTRPGEFVFEKQGTGMNNLVYGDWSTKKVWVRVKVYMRELDPSKQVLVECDAYMVTERGDLRFEEEHKLTWVHRGHYQELLDEISKRLK